MEKPEYLQANLRRYLERKGWSFKKLALEAKVSYHTVFRAVSKGIVPRGGNLQKIAGALGVDVSVLWDNPRKPMEEPSPAVKPGYQLISDAQLERWEGFLKMTEISADEADLIKRYRRANDLQKRSINELIDSILAKEGRAKA